MRLLAKILLPIGLLAGSLAIAGYMRATRPAVQPAPEIERSWTVSVEPVALVDHQPVLQLYGDVVAAREVILRPLVAGEVVETAAALVEGGHLDAGETVLEIDPFDYTAARDELRAQLREAQAQRQELESMLATERGMIELDQTQLEVAGRDLARRERLRGSQASSEKALDDALMEVALQKADLAQRRQTIATLEAKLDQQDAVLARLEVAVRRAERDLDHTRLLAPFPALVTDVSAAVGKRLGVGDPVARLIDLGSLEIRFTLSDTEFGRLWQAGLVGRKLNALWRLGTTQFQVEGEVSRVQATIDAASGGVEVYARITGNPRQAPLRPGAFVEVRLPDRVYEEVVALPASALFHGDTVYTVDDGRLRPHGVQVIAESGGSVLVRGRLEPGEQIVTSRLAEIGPGLKVEVVR